jgi:hypothetical protein
MYTDENRNTTNESLGDKLDRTGHRLEKNAKGEETLGQRVDRATTDHESLEHKVDREQARKNAKGEETFGQKVDKAKESLKEFGHNIKEGFRQTALVGAEKVEDKASDTKHELRDDRYNRSDFRDDRHDRSDFRDNRSSDVHISTGPTVRPVEDHHQPAYDPSGRNLTRDELLEQEKPLTQKTVEAVQDGWEKTKDNVEWLGDKIRENVAPTEQERLRAEEERRIKSHETAGQKLDRNLDALRDNAQDSAARVEDNARETRRDLEKDKARTY